MGQTLAKWCTSREGEESLPARGGGARGSAAAGGVARTGAEAAAASNSADLNSRGAGHSGAEELVDMFDNESGAGWEQYRAIKHRILRGKPEELRCHHKAELLTQLDELLAEAASNGLYTLEDRVSELRDILRDKQMNDLGAELPAPVVSATTAARAQAVQPAAAASSVRVAPGRPQVTAVASGGGAAAAGGGGTAAAAAATSTADVLGLYAAYSGLYNSANSGGASSRSSSNAAPDRARLPPPTTVGGADSADTSGGTDAAGGGGGTLADLMLAYSASSRQ